MTTTYKRAVVAAVALTLTTGLALAKPKTIKTVDVTLVATTIMPDGAQLQPGAYQMAVLNDSSAPQVEFYLKGKLVCRCPVKIEETPTKAETTRLYFEVNGTGTHVLSSAEIEGSTELVLFSHLAKGSS